MLSDFSAKMLEQDIVITFDQNATGTIAKNGYNEQFGARPLRRYIQDNIDDTVAKKILSGELARGDKILITTDSLGNLSITKQA